MRQLSAIRTGTHESAISTRARLRFLGRLGSEGLYSSKQVTVGHIPDCINGTHQGEGFRSPRFTQDEEGLDMYARMLAGVLCIYYIKVGEGRSCTVHMLRYTPLIHIRISGNSSFI